MCVYAHIVYYNLIKRALCESFTENNALLFIDNHFITSTGQLKSQAFFSIQHCQHKQLLKNGNKKIKCLESISFCSKNSFLKPNSSFFHFFHILKRRNPISTILFSQYKGFKSQKTQKFDLLPVKNLSKYSIDDKICFQD